jgi:hypothetical protein
MQIYDVFFNVPNFLESFFKKNLTIDLKTILRLLQKLSPKFFFDDAFLGHHKNYG